MRCWRPDLFHQVRRKSLTVLRKPRISSDINAHSRLRQRNTLTGRVLAPIGLWLQAFEKPLSQDRDHVI